MMKLMLIPESIAMAKDAVAGGVDRIFIDLERAGKFERQGGGTWISTHTLDDVSVYREALPDIELLVRIDPWCAGSPDTVEQVVARGADIIMLPMIENVANVERLCDLLAGRASAVPLIETVHSAEAIRSICQSPVTEIYVGLNDLHRQLACVSCSNRWRADWSINCAQRHSRTASPLASVAWRRSGTVICLQK